MTTVCDNAVLERRAPEIAGLSPIWADWFDANDLRRVTDHPLLIAVASGRVDLQGLRMLLVQQQLYSRHFTRYLTALISRLPSLEDIRGLTENLLEELGVDGEDKITHAELLQRSLSAVGADPRLHAPLPETETLIRTMMRYCRSDDPLDGLAALCLGAEAIVPLLYRPILEALTLHGFDDTATEFFRLHIEEDESHALTMLEILERLTQHRPAAHARAKAVGMDVIGKRGEMFDAVWREIQHRKDDTPRDGAHEDQGRASSADFWRVPAKLQALLPERLHHAAVMSGQDAGSVHFSGERRHKVHVVDLPTHTLSMTIGRLQPAESTRLHRHNYETVLYVIAGKGFSRVGSRVVDWTAGDAVYVPVWAAHQHVNIGPEEAVYIACENAPLLQNLGGIALREELEPLAG